MDDTAGAETTGRFNEAPPGWVGNLVMPGIGISAGQGSSYNGSRQQNPTWLVSEFVHSFKIKKKQSD